MNTKTALRNAGVSASIWWIVFVIAALAGFAFVASDDRRFATLGGMLLAVATILSL